MSHPNAPYSVNPDQPIRTETLRNINTWIPPTQQEITAMLSRTSIKWEELAALTGTPETRVAHWLDGSEKIDYMTWRFLCERAGYGRIELNHD